MAVELEKIEFKDGREKPVMAKDFNTMQDNTQAALNTLDANKQDVLTAGDNITIENGVISSTGGGGGSGTTETVKDIYSTEETKTNETWINGKPIYQKVIPISLNHLKGSGVTTTKQTNINLDINNIENIWVDQSHSYIENNGVAFVLGRVYVQNNAVYFTCGANVDATRLQMEIFYNGDMAIGGHVTIKYTKTTDTV